MTFLFANLKDRDFLVQRISDFLQRTPDRLCSMTGQSVSQSSKKGDLLVKGLFNTVTK